MKEDIKEIEVPCEKFFKLELDNKDLELNNSIFEQFAKDMAKAQDIDFAKTPVIDLFTGYMNCQKYKLYMEMLIERIDKAIEYIKQSIDDPQPFYEYLFGDEDGKVENLDKLLNILQGEDNEN